MPTPPCLPSLLALLLALLSPTLGAAVERIDSQTVVPTEAFQRMRPQTVSNGPTRAPRVDHLVEPSSFQGAFDSKPLPSPQPKKAAEPAPPATEQPPAAEPAPLDIAVQPEPTSTSTSDDSDEGRRLLAPNKRPSRHAEASADLASHPLQSLTEWRPSSQTLTATGGGLAIAVGLLLATTWLIRSCAPKSSRPLPKDVVEVLGRLPLGGKQMTQLIRVGSKLVLVAITPDGAETLTEITDPDEVARLIAACDAKSGRGASADFDQMLHEMSDERITPGFLNERESAGHSRDSSEPVFDPRSLAAAYANTPGGRGDG